MHNDLCHVAIREPKGEFMKTFLKQYLILIGSILIGFYELIKKKKPEEMPQDKVQFFKDRHQKRYQNNSETVYSTKNIGD